MTRLSGPARMGAVFLLWALAVTASPAQSFTTLFEFSGFDGATPDATLTQGADGELYGTTSHGGYGKGNIFQGRLNRGSILHKFNGTDGLFPFAGLVQSRDGKLYGTTLSGGDFTCYHPSGCGTVFSVAPDGTLLTLHNFEASDGANPYGGLVQGFDGNFYGTTSAGGAYTCCGTVFKITPSGALTTLHSFCPDPPKCSDGYPFAGLLQASDGYLYGSTRQGGENDNGTIFKITSEGDLGTIHSVPRGGLGPRGTLLQAIDGNLYGTTEGGILFKIAPTGAFEILHSFEHAYDEPAAALIQATDGNIYGTTVQGGDFQGGTIYKITPEGVFTSLHTFCAPPDCSDGYQPWGGLFQATDGVLYGTTSGRGQYGVGTVYSLDMGLDPFVSLVLSAGKVGTKDGILGQGFTGTTDVSFNGVSALFTVVSDTFIKATVPAGATSGSVTVTTPGGTLKSNKQFIVLPR